MPGYFAIIFCTADTASGTTGLIRDPFGFIGTGNLGPPFTGFFLRTGGNGGPPLMSSAALSNKGGPTSFIGVGIPPACILLAAAAAAIPSLV